MAMGYICIVILFCPPMNYWMKKKDITCVIYIIQVYGSFISQIQGGLALFKHEYIPRDIRGLQSKHWHMVKQRAVGTSRHINYMQCSCRSYYIICQLLYTMNVCLPTQQLLHCGLLYQTVVCVTGFLVIVLYS